MTGSIRIVSVATLLLALVAFVGSFGFSRASAAEDKASRIAAYDKAAAEQAMSAGEPVLLVFAKKGCPVCTKQQAALETLLVKSDFQGIKAYKIDFTKESDLNSKHRVTSQSTLVGFKGMKESGRVAGETDAGKLEGFLAATFRN